MIAASDITGLVLAGGRGSRMDGLDKGLVPYAGVPLALHALRRLQPQVGAMAISANRHLADYRTFGVPVWPDDTAEFAGPLAGMLAGASHARTPWLATVPCDTPLFPNDLVRRLAAALGGPGSADIAMAAAPDAEGRMRRQPVFCLLRTSLRDSLQYFLASGGHKVGQWADQHALRLVPFEGPGPAWPAFANVNTKEELRALEQHAPPA